MPQRTVNITADEVVFSQAEGGVESAQLIASVARDGITAKTMRDRASKSLDRRED